MPPPSRLFDLLLLYEELRDQGRHVTPEELCRDDPDLLDAVREQVAGLAHIGRFVDSTAPETVPPQALPPARVSSPSFAPPPEAQRYRTLNLHAKGGLGEVYLARDQQLNREVALKQMQAHLADHADLRRRFLLEAEVTGRLEHPGIVPVYGLGVDEFGRPYYAMRFIRGDSLQEASDRFHAADNAPGRDPGERTLALRHLLTRFVAVCQAIAYAHSKGVIHRDIKPGNVMLGTYGETLVVDWGLARMVGNSSASSETAIEVSRAHAATQGALGTPAYMAPEQAAGDQDEVGPAADVYALGATLYHLLAGKAPFGKDEIGRVLERVQKGDFVPPRKVKPSVPPALEAVCLKAMALRPQDRYATAGDLAKDVEAFLADEPVSARREPFGERARRWIKRRRTAVVTTLAAGGVALVALTVSTVLLNSAYNDERSARGEADRNAEEAERQRKRAQDGFGIAQQTNATLLRLAEDIRPAPGTQSRAVERVLTQANERYDELRKVAGDTPEILEGKARVLTTLSEVQTTLGSTAKALGYAREAEKLHRRLREAYPKEARHGAGLATALERAGAALLSRGDLAAAEAAHRESRDLRQALLEGEPDEPLWLVQLASSHTHLGNLLTAAGDPAGARPEYERGLRLREQAVAKVPGNAEWRARLAQSQEKIGDAAYYGYDLAGAEKWYEKALTTLDEAIRRDSTNSEWHRQRANLLMSLATTKTYLNKPKEAEKVVDDGLALARQFASLDPAHTEWQRLILQGRVYRSNILRSGDQVAMIREMLVVSRELLTLTEARVKLDPDNVDWRAQRLSMRNQIVLALTALVGGGKEPRSALGEADSLLAASVPEVEALAKRLPDHYGVMRARMGIYLALDAVHQTRGEADRANRARKAHGQVQIDFLQRRHQAEPRRAAWALQLIGALRGQATSLGLMPGGDREAVEVAGRAVALGRRVVSRQPDSPEALGELAESLATYRGALLFAASNAAEKAHPDDLEARVRAELRAPETKARRSAHYEMLEVRKRLAVVSPTAKAHRDLAASHRALAGELRAEGDLSGSDCAFSAYLAVLDRLYRLLPEEANRDPIVLRQLSSTAEAAVEATLRPSPDLQRQIVRLTEQQYGLNPRVERAVDLIEHLISLYVILEGEKPGSREARTALRRAVALLDRLEALDTLPRPLAVMRPHFEKRLGTPPEAEGVELTREQRRALDRMAYEGLARSLRAGKRLKDLVRLLDREARDVGALSWARDGFTRLVMEDLAGDPALLDEVLKVAVELKDDKQAPLGARGRELLAFAARYGGNDEAARALDESLAKKERDSNVVLPLTARLRKRGRYAGAARVLASWLRDLKGASGKDLVALAELRLMAGQLDEADRVAREARRLSPDEPAVEGVLAEINYRARRFAAAKAQLERLSKRAGLAPALAAVVRLRLADARHRLGESDEAEKAIRGVLADDPGNASARLMLASLLADRGKDLDEAERHARAVLRDQPGEAVCRATLGAVLVARKKTKEGLALLKEVADDPDLAGQPEFHDHLGRAYFQAGEKEKARAAWRKALELFPKASDPRDARKLLIEKQLAALGS